MFNKLKIGVKNPNRPMHITTSAKFRPVLFSGFFAIDLQ